MMKSVVSYPFFRTNRLPLALGMAVVFFFGMAQPVMAVPITFIAQGTVDYVKSPLAGTFSIGDTFRVVYTFESTTPDSSPTDPNRGDYLNAITDLTVMIGTYTATASGNNNITVFDNLYADEYGLNLTDPMIGPSVNGYELSTQTALMILGGSTGTALTSDALPTSPAELVGLTGGALALEFIDPSNYNDRALVAAPITSITPEPGSLTLLALGAVALLRRRR